MDGRYLSFSSDRPGGQGGYDIYLAEIDPEAGVEEEPRSLDDFGFGLINTPGFDHGAEWSP